MAIDLAPYIEGTNVPALFTDHDKIDMHLRLIRPASADEFWAGAIGMANPAFTWMSTEYGVPYYKTFLRNDTSRPDVYQTYTKRPFSGSHIFPGLNATTPYLAGGITPPLYHTENLNFATVEHDVLFELEFKSNTENYDSFTYPLASIDDGGVVMRHEPYAGTAYTPTKYYMGLLKSTGSFDDLQLSDMVAGAYIISVPGGIQTRIVMNGEVAWEDPVLNASAITVGVGGSSEVYTPLTDERWAEGKAPFEVSLSRSITGSGTTWFFESAWVDVKNVKYVHGWQGGGTSTSRYYSQLQMWQTGAVAFPAGDPERWTQFIRSFEVNE
jgi:hypothetical protein